MVSSLGEVWSWMRSPAGSKMVRYSLASITSVAVGEVILLLTFGVLRWSAVVANLAATAVATVPSYYLNRRWVWGKSDRSHMLKEVVPFWVLAFVGLAVSTLAVDLAERWSKDLGLSHGVTTLVVNVAWFAALGVVWIGKFLVFEHLMFIDHGAVAEERARRAAVVVSGATIEADGMAAVNGNGAARVDRPAANGASAAAAATGAAAVDGAEAEEGSLGGPLTAESWG